MTSEVQDAVNRQGQVIYGPYNRGLHNYLDYSGGSLV